VNLDAVTGLDLHFPALVLELLEGDDRFGLQTDVDNDHIGRHVDDEPGEDHSRADALVGETLLEELCKTFCHTFTRTDITVHVLDPHPLRSRQCNDGTRVLHLPTFNCLLSR
jgi:hypothetical protein